MAAAPIIFLWAPPRSLSTAFERAFIQRKDVVCIHEPFSEPFYIGPERLSTRYSEEYRTSSKHAQSTYSEMITQVLTAAEESPGKTVFCKDMAYYVIRPDWREHPENPTMLDREFLRRCTHTFLIRTPEKSIPSLYHCCKAVDSDTSFNTEEAGFLELRILFRFLMELQGQPPAVLIDADDLLGNPPEIMALYCERIGLQFQPEMLQWKAEKVEILQKWEGYHRDAEQSTGLAEIARERSGTLPSSVYETIEASRPIYEELFQHRLHL